MKSALFTALVLSGASMAAAQDAPAPAMMAHSAVRTSTVTHNDGRRHRQVTRYRHRTITKTPRGTMVHTVTKTTTSSPR